MKKVLALVLAAVMALSLATVASAAIIIDEDTTTAPAGDQPDTMLFDTATLEIPLTPGAGYEAGTDTDGVGAGAFLTLEQTGAAPVNSGDPDATYNEYALSASVSSSKPDMIKATLVNDKATKGAIDKGTVGYEEGRTLVLKLDPADEFFTVEEHKVEIKVIVTQKLKAANSEAVKTEIKFNVLISNKAHGEDDFWKNADDKVEGLNELSNPVIAADVFTGIAKDKALTLDYGKYTVKFAKVAKQNTALYLKASTSVADGSKAIASIGFKPTRIKDAATITMPINADNENLYGETVYVYALVDGKPTGEAIAAEVVNHNSVIFTVPAGTTLGAFAAYGDKAQGDAEKPAIPETGANDIVNIAIVFAVVALAAAGFAAVKKASK